MSDPSSPLAFPTSDADPPADAEMDVTPVRGSRGPRPLFGTPSPFPGSGQSARGSTVARRAVGLPYTPQRPAPGSDGSPLNFPDSSSPIRQRGSARPGNLDSSQPDHAERPLFMSPSPSAAGSSPLRNRRGDIHPPSGAATSPAIMARIQASGQRRNIGTSSEPDLAYPSSGPDLTAQAPPSDNPDEAVKVIWGTNVSILESMSAFSDFLRNFKIKYRIKHDRERNVNHPAQLDPENGERLLYRGYLRKMRLTSQTNLNLDVINLDAYPPTRKLFTQLSKYPQELVPIMDQVLKDSMIAFAEEDAQDEIDEAEAYKITQKEIEDMAGQVYMVRPFGFNPINMRDLNPSDTDKLCCIKGLVIRATPVIPDMKTAFFRCLTCSHTMQVEIDRGRISEPAACPRDVCNSVGTMSLIHNRSNFADRQVIRLQETPDVVPDGQTPHTVSLCVYDELVDLAKPGDRITVTGIFRSVPVRVNPRQRTVKSLFKTYIDVVHIQRGDGKHLGLDKSTRTGEAKVPGVAGGVGIGGDIEDEIAIGLDGHVDEGGADAEGRPRVAVLEDKLKELSQRPDLYEYLARSLAPSIWEMDDVKKGILLQLFGGANKTVEKGGGGGGPRYRGDINVLLVGDPGTSKSQILHYVHKIAPRGVYTSGKGSSAVGLTAYVTRDPDTKQLVLESGALVLSDGGVCCIDEFDKMSDATRSVLHEVMEQQTVSIAKAGIITTLNARTSILAAANPVQSKYNPNWPIARNIDLPPTLISRFDLLYLVLDRVDEALDRKLAQHLVGLYLEDTPTAEVLDFLSLEMLTAYITYARDHINPVITEAAGNELVAAYVAMRRVGEDARSSERRITATTRQLESLIRLSEAHARMRFSHVVELEDVEEASRLMREAIRASATDPVTGLIDIDLLNTGAGQQQRRLHADLKKEITTLIDSLSAGRSLRWADAISQLNEQSSVQVDAAEFTSAIRELEAEGVLKVVGERDRRTLRKARND